MKKFFCLFISLLIFYCTSVSFGQCEDKMEYMAEVPFPISKSNKNNLPYCSSALDSLKSRLPFVSKVQIGFNISETDTSDWLAILDLVYSKGLKMIVSMQDPVAGHQYRPVVNTNNNVISFNYGKVGEFVANKNCVGHPALFAVNVIDEPFHQSKGVYKNSWLKQIYQELKTLAGGIEFKIYMNFSRMIWKYHYQNKDNLGGQGTNQDVFYSEGICDIVQISTLEFQNGIYLWDQLDGNHFYSRRIIQYYTPDIPLWTSIQTFGGRLGSGNTDVIYWFPRPNDLDALMDSVVNPKYQSIKPLNGMTFQLWDSPDEQTRKTQFTLGDVVLPDTDQEQAAASLDATNLINTWVDNCGSTGINSGEELPTDYSIGAYPNPFNGSTKIVFSIPRREFVDISIYDSLGKKVVSIKNSFFEPGVHEIFFRANNLSGGVYFCRLIADKQIVTNKILLLK